MQDSVIQTWWCGTMKLEVAYTGTSDNGCEHFYSVKATMGRAPISTQRLVELPANDSNPQGENNIKAACNKFIELFQKTLEEAGTGTVNMQMSAEVIKVQLHSLLCQNVEGILQTDQPKWLITPREV